MPRIRQKTKRKLGEKARLEEIKKGECKTQKNHLLPFGKICQHRLAR
jgi:hypothetical protein